MFLEKNTLYIFESLINDLRTKFEQNISPTVQIKGKIKIKSLRKIT